MRAKFPDVGKQFFALHSQAKEAQGGARRRKEAQGGDGRRMYKFADAEEDDFPVWTDQGTLGSGVTGLRQSNVRSDSSAEA